MVFFRKTIKKALIFLLIFLFLEILLRLIETKTKSVPFGFNLTEYVDRDFGWSGKKVFGDVSTNKYKVLIVGDSNTFGMDIKEEDVYYNELKNKMNAELFVYAGIGYGTLQEYLSIKKYVNEINPDLVILQTTTNDIINNNFNLESKSFFNRNLLTRPYLINGEIKTMFPSKLGMFRYNLQLRSRLCMRLFGSYDKFMAYLASKKIIISIEDKFKPYGNVQIKDYDNGLKITEDIFNKIADLVGRDKLVIVPADLVNPVSKSFEKIIIKNNIKYVKEPVIKVKEIENNGEKLTGLDNVHLSKLGNHCFGEALTRSLIGNHIIPEKYLLEN